MLKGWEDMTYDLKPEEEVHARNIAASLRKKAIGKENAIPNKRIQAAILEKYGAKLDGIRIRKMINWIRINNLAPLLCANSKGYYIASDEQEWQDWLTSAKQRIRTQQFTVYCAEFFNNGKEKL